MCGSRVPIQELPDEQLVHLYKDARGKEDWEKTEMIKHHLRTRYNDKVKSWINKPICKMESSIIANRVKKEVTREWTDKVFLEKAINQNHSFAFCLEGLVRNKVDSVCIRIYREAKANNDLQTKDEALKALRVIYDQDKTRELLDKKWKRDRPYNFGDLVEGVLTLMLDKWKSEVIIPDSFDLNKPFFSYWKKAVENACSTILTRLGKEPTTYIETDLIDNENGSINPLETYYSVRAKKELTKDEREVLKERLVKLLQDVAAYKLAIYKLTIGIYGLTDEEIKAIVKWAYPNAYEVEIMNKLQDVSSRLEELAASARQKEHEQELQALARVSRAQARIDHAKIEQIILEGKLKSSQQSDVKGIKLQMRKIEQNLENASRKLQNAYKNLHDRTQDFSVVKIVWILLGQTDDKTKERWKNRIDQMLSRLRDYLKKLSSHHLEMFDE